MSITLDDAPSLSDELAAVDHDWPGWHAWHSDEGRIYAAHACGPAEIEALQPAGAGVGNGTFTASGVTLFAPTPDMIILAIAEYQHAAEAARAMFFPNHGIHPFGDAPEAAEAEAAAQQNLDAARRDLDRVAGAIERHELPVVSGGAQR